jgi:SAM-dependent methyltransferase
LQKPKPKEDDDAGKVLMPRSQPEKRSWEARWQLAEDPDFLWHLDEPPPQLRELIEQGGLPTGAALDVGCGSGIATSYLARFYRPAIGLDIAFSAVRRAQQVARERSVPNTFVVGKVPALPFRPLAFALIFDRGCLQGIPIELWPAYFIEVDKLLKPEGALQIMASKPAKASAASLRGLKSRARAVVGGERMHARHQFSDATFVRFLPASMETTLLEHFPFQTGAGRLRDFTHAIFRKK